MPDFNMHPALVASIAPTMSLAQLDASLRDLQDFVPDAVSKENFQGILDVLDTKTDFFKAPASAKFHLNEEGGLYKHSLGVTYRLLALDAVYELFPQYTKLDVILVGLLHDLGKASQITVLEDPFEANFDTGGKQFFVESIPYYVKRELKTRPGAFEYRRNTGRVVMSIPLGSLHIIGLLLGDFWKPSPTAWAAIAYHDGQYVDAGKEVSHSETKLGLALHQADMFQSRVEGGWENGSGWKG
jgi:hypothetical protein